MEESEQFKKMIEREYSQFKSKIKDEIQQRSVKINYYEKCCLIFNDFMKEIFKNENYNNRYRNVYFFSSKEPKLINNISKEINEKFEIIKKDLLDLINSKNIFYEFKLEKNVYGDYKSAYEELYKKSYYYKHHYYYNDYYKIYNLVKKAKTFNYVAGYNKLIIISENKSALLILNPIDSIINNNNYVIGIILKHNNSDLDYDNELYKLLLTGNLNINNDITNLKLKKNLIVDESENNEELKNILEKIKTYKRKILLKKNRILIFVNLYYYEKNLRQTEKDKAFKEYEDYYLINNDWLNKYKLDNNYETNKNLLKKYYEKNMDNYYDYYKLKNYTFTILNYLVNNTKMELSDNCDIALNELNKIEENFNKSFIMHKGIIQLIFDNENIKQENLEPKKVKVIGTYIYIISRLKLNIGTLNEDLTFNTKYVINYNSKTIYETETKKLFLMSFNEYLKLRKCNVNIKKEKSLANLYGENDSELGRILIMEGKKDEEEASKLENSKLINSENNESQISKQIFDKTILSLKKNQGDFFELKKQYNNIKTELNNKENELDKIKKEKELLEKEIKEKEEEISGLKNGKKSEYSNINKKYKEILDKYNFLENENMNKGKEIEKILKEKEIINDKNQELEQSLKEKNKENEELKNKYIEIEKQLKEGNLLNEDYKNNLTNYEDILQKCQNQINDLDIKYKNKEEEINILKDKNQNEDEKNKETEIALSIKEKEINNIKNENIIFKKELDDKEKELLKIKDELKESSNDIIKLKNEINNLNIKINEKDEEISKMNQLKMDLEIKNENYNNLLKQYKEELEKAKSENIENENNLRNILNVNDNDSKKYQNEILELNKEISEYKNKFLDKQSENEKLMEEIRNNQIKLDEDKKIIEKINSDYKNEEEKVKDIQKQLKEFDEKLKSSNDLINKYENDLKISNSKNDELNKSLEKIMKEKEDEINEIINSNINEINIREEQNKKLKSINEKIESELNNLKNLNAQLKNKNNELNNIINLKENELNNFKKINDELIEKNKKLEQKEKEYLNEIKTYKNKSKEINQIKNEINEEEQININNTKNEIKQLEQHKNNLNTEIYNLTLKLSELEQKIKEKQSEIDKQDNEPKKDKDIIKLEYIFPPNIGLNNVGATCFMNSTLQCLSHTKKLTNYFLNPLNKERILKNNTAIKNPDALQLTPLYLELISKLWAKDDSKTYSPYNFMNGIQSMNPLFQRGQAGDAKDFIIFILEQMHQELKKNMLKNKVELEPLNQYDKSNAFQHFFTEFQADVSIISDIFFGINETTNICLNCKNVYGSNGQNYPICYNYGIFNCIIFPLEEVKKMKNQFMQLYGIQDNRGLNSMNNNRVSLIECFIYNQKTDKFTGDNQNYCNVCRKLQDSDYTSKIYISPNVLVLILNRGKGNIYDVKLDFAENIDVTDFISLREKPRISYNLYGVITHLGKSGPYAHFVASCKSPVDGAWYRFNDGLVSPIKNFQSEIHDFGNPYILFYQKNDF